MKNKQIAEIYSGLMIAKNSEEIRFPARATFSIVRNLKLVEPIMDAIVIAKEQILKELGKEDKDNLGNYFVPPENRDKLLEQMNALDNVDNEIMFYKIKWEDIENLDLSIQIMEALYPMIEEEN